MDLLYLRPVCIEYRFCECVIFCWTFLMAAIKIPIAGEVGAKRYWTAGFARCRLMEVAYSDKIHFFIFGFNQFFIDYIESNSDFRDRFTLNCSIGVREKKIGICSLAWSSLSDGRIRGIGQNIGIIFMLWRTKGRLYHKLPLYCPINIVSIWTF